jgi:hypothetical protein
MQLWFVICSCRKSKFSSCESLIQKIWVVILQVVSTVEEIQERHDAVKEIEKKLLDLHQVYLQEYLGLQNLFSWQLIIIMSNPILLFLRFTLTWQCWLMLKEKFWTTSKARFVLHSASLIFCLYMFVCRMQRIFSSICVNKRLVQVNNAVDHVQRGTTALQSAKKLQKNSRKWMCIAIMILLVIVAIIVVGVLKPWKSNNGAWVRPFVPCPYI